MQAHRILLSSPRAELVSWRLSTHFITHITYTFLHGLAARGLALSLFHPLAVKNPLGSIFCVLKSDISYSAFMISDLKLAGLWSPQGRNGVLFLCVPATYPTLVDTGFPIDVEWINLVWVNRRCKPLVIKDTFSSTQKASVNLDSE